MALAFGFSWGQRSTTWSSDQFGTRKATQDGFSNCFKVSTCEYCLFSIFPICAWMNIRPSWGLQGRSITILIGRAATDVSHETDSILPTHYFLLHNTFAGFQLCVNAASVVGQILCRAVLWAGVTFNVGLVISISMVIVITSVHAQH